LMPFVYVTSQGYIVALKTPEGHLFQALEFDSLNSQGLYDALKASIGWSVGVGADTSVAFSRVVQALDLLRHRCLVFSMSGKCKRWQPVLPHAYFFLAPGDRFAPIRKAAPTPSPAKAEPEVATPTPEELPAATAAPNPPVPEDAPPPSAQ